MGIFFPLSGTFSGSSHPDNRGLAVIESKFSDVDGESEYQGGERGNVAGYKTASIIKKQLIS